MQDKTLLQTERKKCQTLTSDSLSNIVFYGKKK